MAMYLVKFGYTPETWARLLASPEDRREAVGPVVEAAGGKLHGLWYAFGDADGYLLVEAPNDTIAAGILIKAASTAAYSTVSTTKLLTVEESLEAFGRGAGYQIRPPGMAG